MSEPNSNVPGEIADAEVDQTADQAEPERVELDIDEDKLEAWDAVKGDYEIEPGGREVPNSMDTSDDSAAADD